MRDGQLFDTVDLAYCQVVMPEPWDAPPGRFYVAYRARGGFTALIGNGVIDEFRTVSGPILVAPTALLGAIYDVGMRLGEERDIEAPIDSGWPPLTLGIDVVAPEPTGNWQAEMLDAMKSRKSSGPAPWKSNRRSATIDGLSIDVLRCSLAQKLVATVIVTDAPLLPAQLERLADVGEAPVTVALSTGNRLPYVEAGQFHEVDVLPERRLEALVERLERLLG